MLRQTLCLLIVALCFTSGCRRKPRGTDASSAGTDAPAASGGQAAGAAPVVQPGIPIPKEKTWGEKTPQEKHDTYIFWLSQLKGADATRQSQIVAKIQAAGLTAADKVELEKLRKLYSVPPLAY